MINVLSSSITALLFPSAFRLGLIGTLGNSSPSTPSPFTTADCMEPTLMEADCEPFESPVPLLEGTVSACVLKLPWLPFAPPSIVFNGFGKGLGPPILSLLFAPLFPVLLAPTWEWELLLPGPGPRGELVRPGEADTREMSGKVCRSGEGVRGRKAS